MFEIAYASTSGATSSGSGMTSILMIVVMLAIFYFLLIRPENKRKKQAEEMRSSLKKGDWITTIGGVYGRVVTITDRTVVGTDFRVHTIVLGQCHRDQRGSRACGVFEIRHWFCGYPGRAGCRCCRSPSRQEGCCRD